ncbi:unnamed protein product, partial [Nesidiocoris tenuis]
VESSGGAACPRAHHHNHTHTPHRPLELVFTGLTVSVDKRPILRDVSGFVKPGQLLAVMGPSVEQVKGSEEMKEKIVSASKESRLRPDYPQELQPEYFSQNNICDKYLNNFNDSQIHTNGKIWAVL